MAKKTHMAVIPSAGFSHIVPVVEFSKRLLHLHPDFHVHCIIPSLGPLSSSSKSYLQTLPSNINPIFLPPVPENIPHDSHHHGLQIQRTVTLSLPYFREALETLTSSSNIKLAAVIVDVFAVEVLDIASELKVSSYVYVPLSAMLLSFYFYMPKLDQIVSCEFRDLQDPIEMPGCVPVHCRDLSDSVQHRSSQVYKQFLERSRRLSLADGVLVNSFAELETETIKALREESMKEKKMPEIYPVGPILQTGSSRDDQSGSDCLKWLNNQPPKSVLYVSFGSGGTLSQEQLNELAFGLELSGEKFLWVVRPPSNNPSAAYFNTSNDQNPLDFLPEGFLERNKKKGFVIPSWAPQIHILSHSSTGGFLSHCGWNSTLESLQKGVPLIVWPLFAEQRMNSVLLTDGLKVALRPKGNENGIVKREEIANLVKILMEGEEGMEIRKRMMVLKDASANAIKEDGSSTEEIRLLALKWKNLVV